MTNRRDMGTAPSSRSFGAARVLLALMLAIAPLPFGAVYTWAWASLTTLIAAITILWMVGCLQSGKLQISYSPLFVPVAAFIVLGCIQWAFNLTITPFATRESLLELASNFALFFVVVQLFGSASVETWRRVGVAVVVFGFLFSFLSILQFFWNPARIIWVPHDLPVVPFGSYVDRDHYAGLMEMVIPISAGYVLSRPKRDPLNIMLWFGVMVPFVSLLLTGSRGGFIAMLVEIAIWGRILIRTNYLPSRRIRVVLLGLCAVGTLGLFFWLAPSLILSKLASVSSYVPAESEGSRPTIWKDALGIVRDHPLIGTGMGSFATAYPAYQTQKIDLTIEHAHNDYIEALTETGILGGILILAEVVLFILLTMRKLWLPVEGELRWIQWGAMVACWGLLVHTFVDFNLHMPANAAWFAFCAGLACVSGPRDLRSTIADWTEED